MDSGQYCREVESYLCRKNDGHLIRVVGPAFEFVCGWADREIPLRVVFGGIDRAFERYHSKGTRRRPLRVEFCEADVLELFDGWRRTVGVGEFKRVAADRSPRGAAAQTSLADHITRVAERLARWVETSQVPTGVAATANRLIDEFEAVAESALTARGSVRRQLVDRLAEHEQQLMAELREKVDPALQTRCCQEAVRELEPFRARMPPERFREALAAAAQQLLADYLKVPRVRFE